MDPQGNAVVDGRGHHVKTAGECCQACANHAKRFPNNRPCNSWVFCGLPHCWSADNGNTHLFGECWLKWQATNLAFTSSRMDAHVNTNCCVVNRMGA